MATTNWTTAAAFRSECPHTFNALQHLVMAMAKVKKYRGKKSLFGRDKGLASYKKFEERMRDTLLSLILDDALQSDASAKTARETLVTAVALFEQAFPNWQDAYSFANEYFIDSAEEAEARIAVALR